MSEEQDPVTAEDDADQNQVDDTEVPHQSPEPVPETVEEEDQKQGNQVEPEGEKAGSANAKDEPPDQDKLDLKQLTQEFKIEEEEPRPMFLQILITLGLFFGPIMLILDLAIPNFLGVVGDFLLPVFALITLIYIGSGVYRAWHKAKEFERKYDS